MGKKSLSLLALALASACSSMGMGSGMASAPAKTENGTLVGSSNGMTLYTFDKDPAGQGKSNCNGPCAKNWPPLMASAGASSHDDWTVITRDDGSTQWAYDGKPLYFWVKDKMPGDMTGDNFRNVWHVAKP